MAIASNEFDIISSAANAGIIAIANGALLASSGTSFINIGTVSGVPQGHRGATAGQSDLCFLMPGFAKFVVIKKPATKERNRINPFTKEPTIFNARPARKIVRARPVKAVKDAVS